MAEHGIAVEAHLGVEELQSAIFQHAEGVDLQHVHVFFNEHPVEVLHDPDAGFDLRAGQAKRVSHAAAVEFGKAGGGIDGEGQDLFGRVVGHILDAHAAFGRHDDRDARGLAVDQQSKVELAVDVRTVFDVDAVDLLAVRAGLDGHEGAAEHLAGELGGFLDRAGQTDAAFFTSLSFDEVAFAAATGVDLRLHDPKRAIEFTGG